MMGSIMGYSGLNRDMDEGKRNKGHLSKIFSFLEQKKLKSHQ
jgi:hypothetical protein